MRTRLSGLQWCMQVPTFDTQKALKSVVHNAYNGWRVGCEPASLATLLRGL